MILMDLDKYILLFTLCTGLFGVLFTWVYLIDMNRGNVVVDLAMFKSYVKWPFWFSQIMLVMQWFTNRILYDFIIYCYLGLMAAWFITAILILILTMFVKNADYKRRSTAVMFSSLGKVFIMVAILFVFY